MFDKRRTSRPLPEEELSFFAPHTTLLSDDLKNINFKENLEFFDMKNMSNIDVAVLERLNEKLKTIQSIQRIRLAMPDLGGSRPKEMANFFKNFNSSIWENVEVLEIVPDLDTFAFPDREDDNSFELPELLKTNSRLETVIIENLNVFKLSNDSIKNFHLGNPRDTDTMKRRDAKEKMKEKWPNANINFKKFRQPDQNPFESDNKELKKSLPTYIPQFVDITEKSEEEFQVQRKFYSHEEFKSNLAKLGYVKVALLDSGIDYFHPDFNHSNIQGISCVPGEHWWSDLYGHGTHCAGIVAGDKSGIVPGVELYIGKVLNGEGKGSNSGVAEGIAWAIKEEVDIISMSLGLKKYDHDVWEQIQRALTKGLL
eukprot:gb/GECH01007371.1/.p1 GENE.gb/GECH01007371.1/~~gb/GECH01007371.1/.p1  ORF type:complete len:369 (+),score=39.44 gb/GECH01007371.1/:1-1107(+)